MAESDTKKKQSLVVFDYETTNKNPHKAFPLGMALYNDKKEKTYSTNPLLGPEFLEQQDILIAHNAKYDSVVAGGVSVSYCTLIAYYLLHIDRRRKLETIVKDVFGVDKKDLVQVYNECTGKDRKNLPDEWWKDVPEETLAQYAKEDVEWTWKLYEYCEKEFAKRPELKAWFESVEMPLVNILTKSELAGVKLNVRKLQDLGVHYKLVQADLEKQLRWITGSPNLNLNSGKQLQEVMYKKLKLTKLEKTPSGQWSTGVQVLKKLQEEHIFPRMLLQYREITKMLNSFIGPLQEEADEGGCIHCTYNQALTVTRRLSCSQPNLQQIPARSDIGQEIRGCFVPKAGHKFLIADYSQIEPRLLAHFSEDELLVQWFNEGRDVYDETNKVMGGKFSRPECKILLLSFMYGKTPFGLAKDLGCSKEEADYILRKAFGRFKGVDKYIKEQREIARGTNGWIKSLAGLPLYIENINSRERWKYEEGLRQAVNYRIQASSQDILKKAIVDIYRDNGNIPCLLVHDELVYEVEDDFVDGFHEGMIINFMERAWKLKVPLKVEWKVASRWEK